MLWNIFTMGKFLESSEEMGLKPLEKVERMGMKVNHNLSVHTSNPARSCKFPPIRGLEFERIVVPLLDLIYSRL
jgi:hypothetical protein